MKRYCNYCFLAILKMWETLTLSVETPKVGFIRLELMSFMYMYSLFSESFEGSRFISMFRHYKHKILRGNKTIYISSHTDKGLCASLWSCRFYEEYFYFIANLVILITLKEQNFFYRDIIYSEINIILNISALIAGVCKLRSLLRALRHIILVVLTI